MSTHPQSLPCRLVVLVLCAAAPFAPAPARSQPSPEDRQIATLTHKLEKNPRPQIAAQLYADRAEAYRVMHDFARTEQDARAAVRLDPLNGDAHVELGAVYYQQDKDEQAVAEFNRAVALRPYSAWCRESRASAYLDLGRTELAIADFKDAIRLAPRFGDAYCGLATAYAKLGQNEKALVQFNEAISKDPTTMGAYSGRAQIFQARGQYEKALNDIDLALRYDRTGPGDLYIRAQIYRAMGRKDLAAADLQVVSRTAGRDSIAEQFRGKALAELGEPQAALAAFAKGLERFPRSASILNVRAWLEATHPDSGIRNGTLARRDATRACELSHWRDADSIDTLAAACAEAGDYDEAIKYDKSALPLAGKSTAAEIARHLQSFQRHRPWREDPTTYVPAPEAP